MPWVVEKYWNRIRQESERYYLIRKLICIPNFAMFHTICYQA